MIREDMARIIHGLVFFQGQWMPIEKKAGIEAARRKKIEQGYVQYNGEWMTIDEKLARVAPPPQSREQASQTVINKTENRQVYNIHVHEDRRTFHQTVNEHRHLQLDAESMREYVQGRQHLAGQPAEASLEQGPEVGRLEGGGKERRFLEDKKRKRLPPPRHGDSPRQDDES